MAGFDKRNQSYSHIMSKNINREMKKITKYVIIAVFFLSSFKLLAQGTTEDTIWRKKNAFRLGLNYTMNGTGDELSLMYQNEYQRKLNKYLELGVGIGFSNYIDSWNEPNVTEPYEIIETTFITSFDFVMNLLVMDFNRHFFKIGVGCSLRKVQSTHLNSMTILFDGLETSENSRCKCDIITKVI